MMSFLDEYLAIPPEPADAANKARVALFWKWVTERPKEIFANLRSHAPVFRIPGAIVLTSRADVSAVLNHPSAFSVQTYAPKINELAGSFILGMDDGPTYVREVSILRLAASRDDVWRVQDIARRRAEQAIERAKHSGRIDLVRDLSRAVPTAIVQEYFGVSAPESGVGVLKHWLRRMFWHIFLNLPNDPQVREEAVLAGSEFNAHVDSLIKGMQAEIEAGHELEPTVLGRLVGLQSSESSRLDDVGVRRNIAGLVIGAVDTTSKMIAYAIAELLERSDALRGATEAAAAGDSRILRQYLFEASRFRPQNSILYRICHEPFTVSSGTSSELKIPAGAFVIAATQSAMMDPDRIQAPAEFRIDRPETDYILFGEGMHVCFGRFFNEFVVPSICMPLLALPNLRADCPMEFEGPFPDSFLLAFG